MASRIEDYGLIGNMRTAALVSQAGGMDWLCMPRFDSSACFAALIGYDEHGTWAITPTVAVRERRQRYRGDTLILETDVICDGGAVRLTEFMPTTEKANVIRIVEGIEGEVPMQMQLIARFDYGANTPWLERRRDGVSLVAGPDAVHIRAPVKMQESPRGVAAYFPVRKGDRIPFVLTWYPSHEEEPKPVDAQRELERCEKYWLEWAGRCTYQGKWREAVLRSLITLKALTYAPTGGIVAAPTMALPEEIGGVRNWDYRFCWLRDATLTLHALMIGGYVDEATGFRDWLIRAVAGSPRETQIMYTIDGARRLTEFELPWLPGYEGSKPVRVGNAASEQFQLDVYGETLSALYNARAMGLKPRPEAFPAAKILIQHVANVWQHPDDGIWEVRGGRKHFTYSKVMAWVAVDRAARLIEESRSLLQEDPTVETLPWLYALRERIHDEVCERGFHPQVKAFTQYYGGEVLDASVLLIPQVGFLPATDPRMLGTIEAIEKHLMHDGFVLRYATEHGVDGLAGSEGPFLACSFWLAENYALSGRLDEADALMERLLALRTPLGLLAEEYDPPRKRLIGNFPQGFSHLALIAAAQTLSVARGVIKGRAAPRGETRVPQPPTAPAHATS